MKDLPVVMSIKHIPMSNDRVDRVWVTIVTKNTLMANGYTIGYINKSYILYITTRLVIRD